MGLFGIGDKKTYLGIDIGSTSIKLVELEEQKGVPVLLTYGYAERALKDVISGSSKEIITKVANLLKRVYEKAGVEGYRAVTALPNFSVFTSVITVPYMKKKDLQSAINWEAKKVVPMPINQVVLDWRIINTFQTSNGKKNYRVLLTAASKKLVRRYVEIFKQANLELLSLETESFALSRSLLGKSKETTMVIDISALTTDIIIIEDGVPALNRSIDVGGVTISRAIANSLHIDFKRAEQFKRDIGIGGDSKIPQVIRGILNPVIDEMKYSIKLYKEQSDKKIEKVIISGGSAYLPNLPEFFEKVLDKRIIIGNPWSRVAYYEDLRPALQEVAPRFTVAVGLALREIM
ncbi:MAG TPA: type IV pilus assembly protein PilM [Patescibacteria group bacterium]|nr:type IV pilus assembly protein PilM [Patescibacteria group bacterium]